MAGLNAIHSVGSSIILYLQNSYPEPLRTDHPCEFSLVSSGELLDTEDFGTRLSLFLYRVTVNEHLRHATRRDNPPDRLSSLPLDLHYLMTVWADSALAEQTILAWALRQLYLHPVLDVSFLSPEGGWNAGDTIQVVPGELTIEEMMRIWDAIEPPYRLSFPYVARIVQIDGAPVPDSRPVVATRFSVSDEVPLP
jgi:hypothetical protein